MATSQYLTLNPTCVVAIFSYFSFKANANFLMSCCSIDFMSTLLASVFYFSVTVVLEDSLRY